MNQQDFVRDIRELLDQGVEELDGGTCARLRSARRLAMNPAHVRHAGRGVLALARQRPWLPLMLAAGLLLALWSGLQPRKAPDHGELDIKMLTDDIPPQAFADWTLVRREHVVAQCSVKN